MPAKPAEQTADRTRFYFKLTGALLALVGAVWFVVRAYRGDQPKPNLKPFASLGEYAAEESAKLLGKTAKIVLVYDIADPKSGVPGAGEPLGMHGSQAAAFKSRMSNLGRYSFAPDWKLSRPMMAIASVWPNGEFDRLLKAQTPETVLVLLSDPPPLSAANKNALKERPGRLICVGGMLPNVQGLARDGTAHLVIAMRVPIPQDRKAAESPGEWVQRVYAKVTPDQPGLK